MEDLREINNLARVETSTSDRRPLDRKRTSQSKLRFKEPKHLHFNDYTPLNANRNWILEEALSVDLIFVCNEMVSLAKKRGVELALYKFLKA